jgi:hypothetical protein
MFPRSENQGIKRNNSTDTRKLVGISEGKFEFFGNFEQIDTLKDQKKFYYLSGVWFWLSKRQGTTTKHEQDSKEIMDYL